MARPISRWKADQVTFIYICLSLGVKLGDLAEYFNTTPSNVAEVAKRNGIQTTKVRLKPAQVKLLWDQGALRWLF